MAISTINQNGLNAPLTLTTPTLTSPAFSGTPTGTLVSANMPTGSVLQVVQRVSSQNYDLAAAGGGGTVGPTQLGDYYVTITPKFATSKILVMVQMTSVGFANCSGNANWINSFLYRGTSTSLTSVLTYGYNNTYTLHSINYLDSPATTSATTYYVYGAGNGSTGGAYSWNRLAYSNNATTITAMEVAG